MKSKIAFTANVSFLKNNKDIFFNQNEYNKKYTTKVYYNRKVCNETRFFQQKCMPKKTFMRRKYTSRKFSQQ